jgi:hypothetical protein
MSAVKTNPAQARRVVLSRGKRFGMSTASAGFYYVLDGVAWYLGAYSGAVNVGAYSEFMDRVREGHVRHFAPLY